MGRLRLVFSRNTFSTSNPLTWVRWCGPAFSWLHAHRVGAGIERARLFAERRRGAPAKLFEWCLRERYAKVFEAPGQSLAKVSQTIRGVNSGLRGQRAGQRQENDDGQKGQAAHFVAVGARAPRLRPAAPSAPSSPWAKGGNWPRTERDHTLQPLRTVCEKKICD